MYKKSIKIIVAILGLNLLLQLSAIAQDQKTVVVKDESGNPVSGAVVIIGEDGKPLTTNEKGEFVLPATGNLTVLIEAEGFETKLVRSLGLESVELGKMPFEMSQKDKVYIPFGTMKQRQIPAAVKAIDPKEILTYDEAKSLGGILNGRMTGFFGSSNLRGIGTPLYVINGVPRTAVDINPHEIEQITVIKDISAAMMYGAAANNGVVLITTKRGTPLKKTINFTLENGFNKPISYPEYLPAAEYMELYNEALINDNLAAKYPTAQIDSTRSGLNPVRFPDEDYYNSTYLKDWSSYQSIIGEVTGGNERGRFYLDVGWIHSNGLLKIGEGANEKDDRLNLRSNIDYQVADHIDLVFDASLIFNFSRGPRYTSSNDFWDLSTTLRPDVYPVLIPASLLTDEAMKETAKLIGGKYVIGGTSEYQTNMYGELTFNGARRSFDRLVEINTGLNFDLSGVTEGLSAKAYLLFDMNNTFREDLLNSYAVYKPNYTVDTLTSFTKYNTDVKVDTRTVSDAYYYRRYGAYGTVDYHRVFGDHEITANALAYRNEYTTEGVYQPSRFVHFGLRANYMFRNKYIAELTGVYAGSGKLLDTDPYAFSPGIGLGWIISEESFLNDNPVINYLKIRTNWALNNTDENLTDYNLGHDYFVSSTAYPYNDGGYTNNSRVLYTGNDNIGWEKISNFNIGFESRLLDYKLGVEASYFYFKTFDLITRRTNSLPQFFGTLPYENYGSYQDQGVEAGLTYTAQLGEIQLKAGSNFIYSVPKTLIADEIQYPDKYRRTVGKPSDAIFGYVAQGLFKDQSDIASHEVQSFGTVQPGDIKYKDLNSDGVIDENDQKMIGNSTARVEYGFHLNLKYKAFELFALGTGQTGAERYFNNSYYWIYGDRKYSVIARDRWTPATAASASYPRLSSSSNANNFRNSTFWLEKNNWFELHTLQLNYSIPGKEFAGLNQVRVFLRGSNLAKISKIREKTDLNVAAAPQMRVVSLGLNLMF